MQFRQELAPSPNGVKTRECLDCCNIIIMLVNYPLVVCAFRINCIQAKYSKFDKFHCHGETYFNAKALFTLPHLASNYCGSSFFAPIHIQDLRRMPN